MSYVETWKRIAEALHRSVRWCRIMARREVAPLPVYRVGGRVRIDVDDLHQWLRHERERTIARAVPSPSVA